MMLLCIFMDIKGDRSSMLNKLQSLFTTGQGLLRLLLVIGIIGIGASVPILYKYEWIGFGEDSNKSVTTKQTLNQDGKIVELKETTIRYESAKTLWDWLGLGGTIAIPVMIYVFQAGEQRRAEKRADAEKEAAQKRADTEKEAAQKRARVEKEIADSNLREEALQSHIDRMAEILIDKNCRSELLPDKNNSNDTNVNNAVRDVVRIRTITTLRRLEGDKERQGHVLDFLRYAELLDFILSGANLNHANLNKAFLRDANLSHAKLVAAELIGANLIRANLSAAKLFNAKLMNANLSSADLSNAILIDADIQAAKLTDANLEGADLTYVKNLTVEQIKVAKNWEKAKYNPEFQKSTGLPPEAS